MCVCLIKFHGQVYYRYMYRFEENIKINISAKEVEQTRCVPCSSLWAYGLVSTRVYNCMRANIPKSIFPWAQSPGQINRKVHTAPRVRQRAKTRFTNECWYNLIYKTSLAVHFCNMWITIHEDVLPFSVADRMTAFPAVEFRRMRFFVGFQNNMHATHGSLVYWQWRVAVEFPAASDVGVLWAGPVSDRPCDTNSPRQLMI